MLTEPFFWVVVLVVGPFLLSALWTRLKEARRRRRESRRRAEVSDASARLSSTIRVEQRTAHEQIPGLTDLEKGRLLATYSGCAYCGKPVEAGTNLHWDHVLPLTLGGANHVDNVVPACSECNLGKGSKHPDRWWAELGRPPIHVGVATADHLADISLDRIRDAEFVFLVTGGEGHRADLARRFLDAAEDALPVREARLEGARQALDFLTPEWRGYYRPATRYRLRAIGSWPITGDRVPAAAAYRRVRHLERLTEAPLRTIGAVRQETITIERLPVAEWEEEEARRKQLGENIWGR